VKANYAGIAYVIVGKPRRYWIAQSRTDTPNHAAAYILSEQRDLERPSELMGILWK
jgi:hypothetical protein